MSTAKPSFRVIGFVDNDALLHGQNFLGLPVLGPVKSLADHPHDGIVIAIGDNQIRRALATELFSSNESFVSAIHPSVVLGTDVRIGHGAVVCAGVIIQTGSVIDSHTILNTSCTVDHHCHIGAFSHVAPGVHIGGEVTTGEGVVVGIGAVVLPRCNVGDWTVIGGGAVVTGDQPAGVTVVGVPAHVIKS
jgi:sugar O-acyltransferase (sialic acid O-acetyltransferase NeuD family)